MNFKSPAKPKRAKRLGSPKGHRVTTEEMMAELRSITTEQELLARGRQLWMLLGRYLDDTEERGFQLAKSVSYADMLKEQTLALISTIDAVRSPQKRRTEKPTQQSKAAVKRNSSPKCMHTEASPVPKDQQHLALSPTTQAFRFVSYSYDNAAAKPKRKALVQPKPLAVVPSVDTEKQRLERELKTINDQIYEQRVRALERCYARMSGSNVDSSKPDQQSLQPNDSRVFKEWHLTDSQSPGKVLTSTNPQWRPNRDRQTSYNSCFLTKHDSNTPDFSFNADSRCQSEPNNENQPQQPNISKAMKSMNGSARPKQNPMAKKLIRRTSGDGLPTQVK